MSSYSKLFDFSTKEYTGNFNGKKLACACHCHSHDSVDGASTIEQLAKKMASVGMTHMTITEHGNLNSAAAVHRVCNDPKKGFGLKVVHGVEGYIYWPGDKDPNQTYHITIWFKTRAAFEAYCKITPDIFSEPRIKVVANDTKGCMYWEDFLKVAEHGIVVGTGCVGSWLNKPLANSGNIEEARKRLDMMIEAVGVDNIYDEWIVDDLSYDFEAETDDHPARLVMNECRPWFLHPCIGRETNRVRWSTLTGPKGIKRLASQDAHYADKQNKVVQDNKRYGSDWIMSMFQHVKGADEFAELAKSTHEMADRDIEELIDNTHAFVENFNDYSFLTSKDRGFMIPKFDGDARAEIISKIETVGRCDLSSKEIKDRIDYEMDVLSSSDKLDGLSYMLLASDIAETARSNNILVNTRGCLSGETPVLTREGYKRIDTVEPGDEVVTLSGKFQKVLKRFEYPVDDEELLSIGCRYSFGKLCLTRDHKVYACKREILNGTSYKPFSMDQFDWYRADQLDKGDLLFTPWPEKSHFDEFSRFDLSSFISSTDRIKVTESSLIQETPIQGPGAIRTVSRVTGVARCVVKNLKNGGKTKDLENISKIVSYLSSKGLDFNSWIGSNNVKTKEINRFVDVDEEFCYLVGKWIGDGWLNFSAAESGNGYRMGIAFFSEELCEVDRTVSFLKKNGFEPSVHTSKTKRLTQVCWSSEAWFKLFSYLFPDYKDSATKSFGKTILFSDQKLRWVVNGMYSADGSVRHDGQGESYDTTSMTLALQLKEVLLRLRQQSTMQFRESHKRLQNGKEYLCSPSYKISSKGLLTCHENNQKFILENGYVSPIYSIETVQKDTVYDLHVENEHNYLTSSGIVHNSSGGSLLAYGIGLSLTDPLSYGLQFERFLTKGRIAANTPPDIDIDCSRRDLLLSKLYEKYSDRMIPISTNSLLKPRSAIKDAERFLLGSIRTETEILTKRMDTVPQGVEGMDWLLGYEKDGEHVLGAIETMPELKQYSEDNPEIWSMVIEMCGIMRQKSVHSCAILMSSEPVHHIMPLYRVGGRDGTLCTGYEPKDVEYVGGLKVDLLGVTAMDTIQTCLETIDSRGKERPEFGYMPYDEDVYKNVYWNGKTEATFQTKTDGITALCEKTKPFSIVHLSNLIALYRPGCLDWNIETDEFNGNAVDFYVKASRGEISPYFIHKDLEPIFGDTYGVPLFQEQILRCARDIAGKSYEEAEALRRAIGKKDAKAMLEFFGQIAKACTERGWTSDQIEELKSMIMASSRYSFNCAHSTSYGIVSYQTAYLKHKYPLEFWCAELTTETDNDDKMRQYSTVLGDAIVQPSIVRSDASKWLIDEDKLVAPLKVLKGCGESTSENILKLLSVDSLEELGIRKAVPVERPVKAPRKTKARLKA